MKYGRYLSFSMGQINMGDSSLLFHASVILAIQTKALFQFSNHHANTRISTHPITHSLKKQPNKNSTYHSDRHSSVPTFQTLKFKTPHQRQIRYEHRRMIRRLWMLDIANPFLNPLNSITIFLLYFSLENEASDDINPIRQLHRSRTSLIPSPIAILNREQHLMNITPPGSDLFR